MQKITKILQNRLMKSQKLKKMGNFFTNEIQLFHYSAVNSKPQIWQPKLATTFYITILMGYLTVSQIYITENKQTKTEMLLI